MGDRTEKKRILTAKTTTGAGTDVTTSGSKVVFQITGQTTAGAGEAEVAIQGTLDGTNWVTLGTISLVLSTTVATDGFASDAPWERYRPLVNSISGTGASLDGYVGVEV